MCRQCCRKQECLEYRPNCTTATFLACLLYELGLTLKQKLRTIKKFWNGFTANKVKKSNVQKFTTRMRVGRGKLKFLAYSKHYEGSQKPAKENSEIVHIYL